MKTILFPILVFLLTSISFNVFAQEWKFRDKMFLEIDTLLKSNYKQDTFPNKADFRKKRFKSIALFGNAQFDSTAYFSESWFFSGAYFQGVQFESKAIFFRTKFYSTAYFRATQFDSTAVFFRTKFYSTAYFRSTKFKSRVDFRGVKFADTVNFRGVQFLGEITFTGDTLPKYVDFSNVNKVSFEVDLTKSEINPDYDTCYINITNAAIDKFRFRYNRFKLWFPKTYFDRWIKDSIKEVGFELKANVYEELLLKQKAEGFTQSYEKLDKEYREFQYTDPGAKRGNWGKLLNWVDKYWWGYGYDKELIIRNVFIIFLFIALLNSFFLKHLVTDVYNNEKIEELLKSKDNKNWLSKWFNSLRYSVFYTAVIFFSFNFDLDKLNYAGNLDGWRVLNLTWFMVIYLGGVVCMAYLANFIITV